MSFTGARREEKNSSNFRDAAFSFRRNSRRPYQYYGEDMPKAYRDRGYGTIPHFVVFELRERKRQLEGHVPAHAASE